MNPRSLVVHGLTGAALTAALLSPGAASAAVNGTATVSASYTCSVLGQTFDLPVAFTLTASGSGNTTTLTASGGRPTLPLDGAMTVTRVTSTLTAVVNGEPTELTGRVASLTARPDTPIDLPELTTNLTAPGPTLTFTPGAFSMALTAGLFPATFACTTKSTPATVTLGRTASTPPPAPKPDVTPDVTPKPAPSPSTPALTVKPTAAKVSRASVKGAKKKARVTVTLRRASSRDVTPRGTLTISVGKKKVRSVRVSGASTTVRVQLPRALKKGRHHVRAAFVPNASARAGGVRPVQRRAWVRVTA